MCFDYDYDWTASVSEANGGATRDRPTRCDECRATIPAGTPFYHLWQQEHDEDEAIERAWDGLEEDFVGPPEPCYGETFDYECCLDCQKLREAVRASELEAGCDSHEAEPPLPVLFEAIRDSGCGARYAAKAREMFPELEASGYLARVRPRMGLDEEEA